VIAVLLILLISGFSLISYDLFSARLNFCSDAGTYAHGNHRASHAIPNPQLAAMGAHSQVALAPRLFLCAQRQQPQPGVVPLLERRGVCGRLDGSDRVGRSCLDALYAAGGHADGGHADHSLCTAALGRCVAASTPRSPRARSGCQLTVGGRKRFG
jgi:hypothetical protein